eukprot:12429588-Karenia_brevis.AAC.1
MADKYLSRVQPMVCKQVPRQSVRPGMKTWYEDNNDGQTGGKTECPARHEDMVRRQSRWAN